MCSDSPCPIAATRAEEPAHDSGGGGGQALLQFPTTFGGPPDMVLVAALLWDLARWKLLNDPEVMASDQLPEALMAEWRTNAGSLLRQIKVRILGGNEIVRLPLTCRTGTLLQLDAPYICHRGSPACLKEPCFLERALLPGKDPASLREPCFLKRTLLS